jgi:head-tail adaptor
MRAGRMDRIAGFYAKVKTPTLYGGTTDTWPTLTLNAWGEVQFAGGDAILSNDEKFYSGVVFLKIRYRTDIVETMRVSMDSKWYSISYIEELGRREGLRLTLNRINE